MLNGTTNGLVSTIPVGNNPNYLAVDTLPGPNFGNIFVTNYASNTVSVIDWRTNKVIDNVSVPGNPKSIVFDPLNGNFYTTDYSSGTISEISGSNDTLLGSATVGPEPNEVAFDPIKSELVCNQF